METTKLIDKAYYRLLVDYNYHNPKGTIVQYHEEGMSDLLSNIKFHSMKMGSWLGVEHYEVEILTPEETMLWKLRN